MQTPQTARTIRLQFVDTVYCISQSPNSKCLCDTFYGANKGIDFIEPELGLLVNYL